MDQGAASASSTGPSIEATVDNFVNRWQGVTASELSTAQSFVIELCRLLDVDPPHPTVEQDYMFERPITFHHGDGSTSPGRVDCYKRGHFVWESKKLKAGVQAQATGTTTKAFDDALLRARQQAEDYARALPASEGRPPLVAVVDVGHVIELYAEFTRSGATYTPFPDPRSHRIRLRQLSDPTVVEPLRADWANAQAAAVVLAREADELDGKKREAKLEEARAEVRRFHHQLCTTRVLDPACGSGNFLYVTLEHLKRLEGEVMNQLEALGETQDRLGLEGETVTLQQLRGIELNERAAALAELVLWIGWLQWHVRTRGLSTVAEPVVHDYGNIENRDAVLAYDSAELAMDAAGKPITRWDGVTFKKHPVTGEDVPDEAAQVAQWRYVNPRQAEWPAADFIVGNPPFIGSKRMRDALGDGYVDGLQAAWPRVPEATDFVMRWWHKAALEVGSGRTRRFGLITSNSLRQAYVRRAVEPHLVGDERLSIIFAVPDHPWVDSADGAAVRIAMTVAESGLAAGQLREVLTERNDSADGNALVEAMDLRVGMIGADLRVGANVAGAKQLRSNLNICSVGMKTIGGAFQIGFDEAQALGLGNVPALERHIRPYFSGRDFVSDSRGLWVVDFFGLDSEEVRTKFPAAYQHLLTKAKPERDQNRNAIFRRLWWVIGHPRPQFRIAGLGLPRYIVTVETSKHRLFGFVEAATVPDSTLVTIATSDATLLGILSSLVHVEWSLAAGGRLGVGKDPRYNKSRCFEPFPFPSDDTGLTPDVAKRIRDLAEQLDAHRKARQAAHENVTLTGLYNVLDKLRRGEALNAKDKQLHEHGLVSVLHSLHEDLDAAVLQAYGWADLGPVPWHDEAARAAWTETLLERLVALNARRAAEEAAGTMRWLRPEFQNPAHAPADATPPTEQASVQNAIEGMAPVAATLDESDVPDDSAVPAPAVATASQAWPSTLPDQVRVVAQLLADSPTPLALPTIENAFKGRGPWKRGLPRILETLEALGRARQVEGGWRG